MAETVKQTKMSAVGNATDYSLSLLPDRGASDVPDANPSTKVDLLGALSELENHEHNSPLRCHIALVLEDLDADEAVKLAEVLDNVRIRGTWIVNTLSKYGYKVSAASVQRHRRRKTNGGGCTCR